MAADTLINALNRGLRLIGLQTIRATNWTDRVQPMTPIEVLHTRRAFIEREIDSLDMTKDRAFKQARKVEAEILELRRELQALREWGANDGY